SFEGLQAEHRTGTASGYSPRLKPNASYCKSYPSLPFDGHLVPVRTLVLQGGIIQMHRQGLIVFRRRQLTNLYLATPGDFGELDIRRSFRCKGGLQGEVRIAA